MTVRTIAEISDMGSDMDTATVIRVAPAWVYLEYADAVALRDALTVAIEEARKNRRRKR